MNKATYSRQSSEVQYDPFNEVPNLAPPYSYEEAHFPPGRQIGFANL